MKINQEIVRIVKYGIVGLANTAVTYLTYIILRFLGAPILLSNITGYVLGLANSFVCNKKWVFKHDGKLWKEIMSFGCCFIISYAIQLVVLLSLNRYGINEYIVQLIAMISYTLTNYLLNRIFTFSK